MNMDEINHLLHDAHFIIEDTFNQDDPEIGYGNVHNAIFCLQQVLDEYSKLNTSK